MDILSDSYNSLSHLQTNNNVGISKKGSQLTDKYYTFVCNFNNLPSPGQGGTLSSLHTITMTNLDGEEVSLPDKEYVQTMYVTNNGNQIVWSDTLAGGGTPGSYTAGALRVGLAEKGEPTDANILVGSPLSNSGFSQGLVCVGKGAGGTDEQYGLSSQLSTQIMLHQSMSDNSDGGAYNLISWPTGQKTLGASPQGGSYLTVANTGYNAGGTAATIVSGSLKVILHTVCITNDYSNEANSGP